MERPFNVWHGDNMPVQAPFYKMACNHMNFPEEKNLVKLREIISKHWGI